MKYLIVGLGNMGADYELTRHNIGFLALNQLAAQHTVKFQTARLAAIASFKYKGRILCLVQPTTYMNLSGKAVNYWLKELKIPVENSLVITDDLALPFGKLRMRAKGSNAGHNGLGNIDQVLGGNKYPRLRFGIGDDFSKGRQVEYVLSDFSSKEREELPIFIEKAADMALSFAAIGIERTMNFFNS